MKLFLLGVVLAQVLSQNVESAILQEKRVERFEYAAAENILVVGLITTPVFLRSDNIEIINSVKKNLQKEMPSADIYVSIDADIYYKIKSLRTKDTSYSKLKELVEEIAAREKTMMKKAS